MRTALLSFFLFACGGEAYETSQAQLFPCGETPAPALFEHALCLCGDLDDVGRATIGPGRDQASLAVNGRSQIVSETIVDGDFIAYGGLSAVSELEIRGHLQSAEDVSWVGSLVIRGDASIGGDFTGVGELEVEGNVATGGDQNTVGVESVGGVASYLAPSGPPCNCDPSSFIDVRALVAAAQSDNDNEARGLDPRRVSIGRVSLALETGRYYFEDTTIIGSAHLTISGAVSIYVDGDLETIGDDQIEILAGGSLDLFVSGSVATVGSVRLGDPDDPSAFRLYIGGKDPVHLSVGLTEIAGSIYAPTAEIAWVGDTSIDGAVFANELHGVGELGIRYTRPVAVEVEPGECPEPSEDMDDRGPVQPEI